MDSHKVWLVFGIAIAIFSIRFLIMYSMPSAREAVFGKGAGTRC